MTASRFMLIQSLKCYPYNYRRTRESSKFLVNARNIAIPNLGSRDFLEPTTVGSVSFPAGEKSLADPAKSESVANILPAPAGLSAPPAVKEGFQKTQRPLEISNFADGHRVKFGSTAEEIRG